MLWVEIKSELIREGDFIHILQCYFEKFISFFYTKREEYFMHATFIKFIGQMSLENIFLRFS